MRSTRRFALAWAGSMRTMMPSRFARPPRGRTLLTTLLLAWVGLAATQDDPTATLRDLLARGFYNAAAQLEAPNLVEQYPNDPEVQFLYARATYLTGDLRTARTALTAASGLLEARGLPLPATYVHLDGLLLDAVGATDAALVRLREAFAMSGAYREAMDLGRVAWRDGRLDEALRAYAAAAETEVGADEPWPLLNQGRILVRLGRTAEARNVLQAVITRLESDGQVTLGGASPAYVEAYYRLGEAFELEGSVALAQEAYQEARRIDPGFTPAIQALDRLARPSDGP